jgi:hypothetical protein
MPRACILVRSEPYYRRAALEAGLTRLGYTIDIGRQSHQHMSFVPESRHDLLVLWNRKHGVEEEHAERFEARGGSVVVMENGYLQRQDKTIYALSVHGHNGSGWFPFDDAEDRFSRLGFPLKPWRERTEGHVLVCGQRGIGSKLMRSPAGWAENAAGTLTARFLVRGGQGKMHHPIRVRPHPGNFVAKVPLIDDLEYAWACVVWSSAAGVRALVEGVPVYRAAPRWICGGVASHPKYLNPEAQAPTCSPESRRRALNRMAHGQWSVSEIESGEPFARMRDLNWGESEWA